MPGYLFSLRYSLYKLVLTFADKLVNLVSHHTFRGTISEYAILPVELDVLCLKPGEKLSNSHIIPSSHAFP